MKKKRNAMASGMATLGTRMYRISILFFSLESFESGHRREREQRSYSPHSFKRAGSSSKTHRPPRKKGPMRITLCFCPLAPEVTEV